MVFSRFKIYLVITLTIASLVAILIVQYRWIDSARRTQEIEFDRNIALVAQTLVEKIKADSTLRQQVAAYAKRDPQPAGESATAETDTIRTKLNSLVDSSFRQTRDRRTFNENFAQLEYEFGLVQHSPAHTCCSNGLSEEKVLLSSVGVADTADFLETQYRTPESLFNDLAHINLHFSNKDFFLAYQILTMLALSVLGTLIIVGCFAYTILTIRKQKKLAEMKNDFINNMTHELKTPIFSISLASKTIGQAQQIKDSPRLQKYLGLIDDESERLKSQVDKVLEMTLADSEKSKIEKEDINLHQLIREVAHRFDLILSKREGEISLKLEADSPVIHADRIHLANILQNLIDNAIKYNRNEPHITIRTEDREEGISFSVMDNGIGMDAKARKHIFDKFYRVQSGDIHDVKGFGLGLNYVKNIVEAHSGHIKLNSKINQGSTFTVYLPA